MFMLCFNIYAVVVTGGNSLDDITRVLQGAGSGYGDNLKIDIIDLTKSLRADLTKVQVGAHDFDSVNDRWVLKTATRVLSVKNVDLVDKFIITNRTINEMESEYSNYNLRIREKLLKNKIKKLNIINPYSVDDFLK